MAGDWIKMQTGLAEDPAVIAIACATRLDVDSVVGKLHRIWSWADQHTADGRLEGVPASWIDQHVKRKGFAQAMTQTVPPWLLVDDAGVTIPSFNRHNGQCAKRRALTARRAANFRGKSNASSVTESAKRNADSVSQRREEKRREEKREVKDKGAGKKRKRVEASMIDLPDRLDTPEVRKAVGDWLSYKAKRGQAYQDASFLGNKVSEYEEAGPAAFVAAVNSSIGNNYSGIYPEKDIHGNSKTSSRVGPGQRYQGD